MSRVFVSYSHRDRAVGEEVGSIVRALGHETLDDRDEKQGAAWWNEVVGRIEACDVFVAVASPTYVEAQSCRLAAKHAAASGLAVVRVDLDRVGPSDCHPVVAGAVGVPYAPDDPDAVARLTEALAGPAGPAEPIGNPGDPPADPGAPGGAARSWLGLYVGAAVAAAVVANGLIYLNLQDGTDDGGSGSAAPVAEPTPGAGAPAGPTAPAANAPRATDATMALLAQLEAAGGDGLPTSSCEAGESTVTCTKPAASIQTVVLTPYPTSAALYDAYTATVQQLSGEPVPENTDNCSATESEGELGWNTDKRHTLDYSVSEQREGGLDPASESAGRVFCTDTQKVMRLVWTHDPGLLVTATGQPSELVIGWWAEVHLQLACASGLSGTGCDEAGP